MREILTALKETKHEFHALALTKTGKNKFANYEYFELSDFITPLETIMHAHNLVSMTSFTADIATLTVYECETGQSLSVTSPMSKAELKGCHDVQNLGAVQTYLRRYLYQSLIDIVESDGLDGTTGKDDHKKPESQSKQPPKPQPESQPKPQPQPESAATKIKQLFATATEKGVTNERVKAHIIETYAKESTKALTVDELNKVIADLKNGKVK